MLQLASIIGRRVTRTLSRPVGGAGHRTDVRESLELELRDPEGRVGRGEAAPLPGYSADTLADVERALERLLPPTIDLQSIESPSLRSAVECALLDLFAQQEGVPMWQALRGNPHALSLALCAPLLGDDAALAHEAESLRDEGYDVLKRKITSRADLDALAGIPGPLRLDGNRALSLEALEALAPAIDALEPELVEEPLDGSIIDAARLVSAPLAIDESLAQPGAIGLLADLASFMQAGHLRAIVLKPARDGFLAARTLAARARELGAEVVVTHQWDGPIGHLAAIHLAIALGGARRRARWRGGSRRGGRWAHPTGG